VPVYPPEIPQELTQASTVRGQRLTAWAVAQPTVNVYSSISQTVVCRQFRKKMHCKNYIRHGMNEKYTNTCLC
jgi:hypothetical protein